VLPPEFPLDESARLRALRDLNLLDTPEDERFDRLTRLAQAFFGTQIALVSLLDADRQWFKSRQGLVDEETARDISFCGHAIASDEVFSIPDARHDERFRDNPLVLGAPHIRLYAGAPIHAPNNARIGTLCVIDDRPRELSSAELQVLKDLAACVDDVIAEYSQQRAANILAGQESYLRSLLSSMDDAVLTIDAAGVIRTANPAAARMMGMASRVDLMGRALATLRADPRRSAEPGWELQKEHEFRRANGSLFQATLTLTPLAGSQNHRLVILRDITELKAADRAKSEFIATVSHELRTPLTSIRGSLGLVLGGALGEFPDKAKRMLDLASRNAERLAQLINDLLDIEKMSAGGMSFTVVSIAGDAAVEAAIAANEGYALRHEVSLRVAGRCVDTVQADELRLQQVFANLISNAIKYSPKGSTVDLSACVDGDSVRFSVRDHGSGIPEDFRERIFQRFSQADSSDMRARGGTGLGLNIARAIVEELGGSIGFDTSAEGTTFFFCLPRHARAVVAGQVLAVPVATVDVLLCSNNREVVDALQQVLATVGLRCDIAAGAGEAMQQIDRHAYRLLLLDIGSPEREELKFPVNLRYHHNAENMRFMMLSGRRPGEESAIPILGLSAWLQRPVDPAHLLTALNAALGAVHDARVLHVEDDSDYAQVVAAALSPLARYHHVPTLAAARTALAAGSYDILLLDPGLPDGDGAALLPSLPAQTVVVLLSGQVPESMQQARVVANLRKGQEGVSPMLRTIKTIAGGDVA
jgi:PAS domain S-box-containing protein